MNIIRCQTQEELAESLGVTQQAILKRIKVMEIIQKQGNWVPYPTRRTRQTLFLPTTISFDRWHTAWLISIPALMKMSKMYRFVDRVKRRIVFSRWYPLIVRKVEKSNG